MVAQPTRFAALFEHPTVEAMHGLANGKEFERFVAYVLRRAGYDAKEVGAHWLRGVDLEMRRPGSSHIVGGVECKRFQTSTLVDAKIVGNLLGAAAVSGAGAKPYVFTTSDFHPNAHKKAKAGRKKAYLMNGAQLVRYITYIRGSRYDVRTLVRRFRQSISAMRTQIRHAPTPRKFSSLPIIRGEWARRRRLSTWVQHWRIKASACC